MNNKFYTSIEQSRKLLELGLDGNTADMMLVDRPLRVTDCPEVPVVINTPVIMDIELESTVPQNKLIPCWSFGALLEVMPKRIFSEGQVKNYTLVLHSGKKRIIWYQHMNDFFHIEYDDTLIDTCYKMVIWLLKNGYIKKIMHY